MLKHVGPSMLLLSNGLLFDGTGSPPVEGSIVIEGDRIAAVNPHRTEPDTQILNCSNLAISPGFIDLHSHSDLQVLEGRTEKLKQGVTTEAVGNCGFSPFPYGTQPESLRSFASGILYGSGDWGWRSATSYFERLTETGANSRAAVLVGHGSLRIAVTGLSQAPLSQLEMDRMIGLLEDSLDAGCAGFSTGLMYAPGSSAPPSELDALCRIAARRDKLYATHMRSYSRGLLDAVREQLDLAERTGCRLQISHLQAAGRACWDLQQRALDAIESAHARRIDVEFDIYPYQCGSTVLTQLLPQRALEGGTDAMIERLKSKAQRSDILREMRASRVQPWSDVTISGLQTAANQPLIGKSIEEISEVRGTSAAETIADLLIEEDGAVNIISFNQSEPNLRQLIAHPLCSVITDGFYVNGKAHPRLYGTFPELLGKLVRDRAWLSLPEAIHKITQKPAARLKLQDCGLIRAGSKADLTIFNPNRISSNASYDDPAVDPEGIAAVIKDGQIVFRTEPIQ